LNEKLNSENRVENIEALRTRLRQTEEQLTNETDRSLFREFVIGADSFGQLSSGIPNRILSGLMYWLIVAIVMGILFIITGLLIVGIGYQVGKIYRKYCWDIISIVEVITSTAIAIYFGDWIKSVISINLITLLLLVHVVYIGIRCYVKDWMEERGYC